MLKEDLENGLIPFWYGASYGTTNTCAFDQIDEIGEICEQYGISFNVDAAYAGGSWVIPECRAKVKGLEKVDSLQVNFSKMMMCGMTSALLYVKSKKDMKLGMGGTISNYEIYHNKFSSDCDVWEYKDW